MIGILVADDHPVVRRGIREILADSADVAVVAEAVDGSDVLMQARSAHPDMIILDLSMPGPDSLDVLKQLRRELPSVPVVVLTMHAEQEIAVRALKAGASGYLTKETAPVELLRAIRRVEAGGRYVSASIAETIAGRVAATTSGPPHETLSDREYQVFRMLAAGKTTREISSDLRLSAKTIGTYRSRLLTKMGMRNAAELATYVAKHHLAD